MNRQAFVLMPLASEFDDIYEYLIRDAVGSRSPSEVRINELGEGQSLYMTILSGG